MVAAEISAGVSALSSALNITKGLKDLDDRVRVNDVRLDLQEKILAAQEAQSALLKRVSELEKEVANLKAWDADKKRYILADAGSGALAYSLKEGMEDGEHPHKLCASCYQYGEKSILQEKTLTPGRAHVLICHDCGWHVYLSGMSDPQHKTQLPPPYRGER